MAVFGLSDGNFVTVNLDTQEQLYGFGVMRKGGINVMKFLPDYSKVLVAGDDPYSMLIHFKNN